jgi:simple sugar transport system permease protein
MLFKTNLGLNIRAAGWKPVALDNAGVDVLRIRTIASLMTGALAGLGGGYMAIVTAGIFVPFMTGGLGFIAIVIAMLGRGRPVWVLIGSLLFGIALSIATALQLVGINVPTDVVQMLPFIAVMVALALFARQSYLPAALAAPFVRGQR